MNEAPDFTEEEKEKYIIATGEDARAIFTQLGYEVMINETSERFEGSITGTLEGAAFHFYYSYQTVAEARRLITKFFGTHQEERMP